MTVHIPVSLATACASGPGARSIDHAAFDARLREVVHGAPVEYDWLLNIAKPR